MTVQHVTFSANEPTFTLKCYMRLLFKKYSLLIFVSMAGLVALILKIRAWLYNYRVGSLANHLYKELKGDLDGMGRGASAGISEKEIFHKY